VATLIISDLHLGNGRRHDVLRASDAQAALWQAVHDVDRLVLLGDIVELMSRRAGAALAAAEPILRDLGRHLQPGAEVIIVPGNHDAPLVRRWALARGAQLGVAESVPLDASAALRAVADWLSPASVRASYPGVWLDGRVWASHGHYLDRHLAPASTVGMLRPDSGTDRRLRRPSDYERSRRRQHERHRRRARRRIRESRRQRWRERPVGTLAEEIIGLARSGLVPLLPRLAGDAGLARLTAASLDLQMRHAATRAMLRVVERLEVEADWVVFGHVHRRGPLPAEAGWPPGAGRLLNTGSWLHEPLLVDGVTPPHPYWPGGGVRLEPGGVPYSVGLLDDGWRAPASSR
jgi:UDP-2,3-diacylglucosamine pyrophosphatase LpxH